MTFLTRSLSNLSSSSTKDFDFKQKAENIKTHLNSYSDETRSISFFPEMKSFLKNDIISCIIIICILSPILFITIKMVSIDLLKVILLIIECVGIASSTILLIISIIKYLRFSGEKTITLTAKEKNLKEDITILKNQAQAFFQETESFILSRIKEGIALSEEEILQVEFNIKTHINTINNLQKDINEIQSIFKSKFPFRLYKTTFSYLSKPIEKLNDPMKKNILFFQMMNILITTIKRTKTIEPEMLTPSELIFQNIPKFFFLQKDFSYQHVVELKEILNPLTQLLYKKISQTSNLISRFNETELKIKKQQKPLIDATFYTQEKKIIETHLFVSKEYSIEGKKVRIPGVEKIYYWNNERLSLLIKLMQKINFDSSFRGKEELKVLFINNKQDKVPIIFPNYEQESDTIIDPYHTRNEQEKIDFEKKLNDLDKDLSKEMLKDNSQLTTRLQPMICTIETKIHEISEIWLFLEAISFLTDQIFQSQNLSTSHDLEEGKKLITQFFPKMSQSLMHKFTNLPQKLQHSA